ncbi:MAG: hypothetical protein ACTTIS_00235 [Streptobacillus sp.]|jgi:hypothetical protein|nr:MAG TPA: protein of unknown function (DUF543) [Caudoviricetes sp.]
MLGNSNLKLSEQLAKALTKTIPEFVEKQWVGLVVGFVIGCLFF